MRDLQSEYRVIEMLHAIKIFINAANNLTEKDIKSLEQIGENMKKTEKVKPKEMTVSEIEKALGYPVKIVKEENSK